MHLYISKINTKEILIRKILLFLFFISSGVYCLPSLAGVHGIYSALQSAVNDNPQVLSKMADVRAQTYRISEAKASRLPGATIETASRDDGSISRLIRVQQPLWGFGQIDAAIDVAESREALAKVDLLLARRQAMEDVISIYTNLVSSTEKLASAEDFGSKLGDLLRMIERREKGGLAATADVRLALARKANADNTIIQLKQTIQRYRLELESLTRMKNPSIDPLHRLDVQLDLLTNYLNNIENTSALAMSRKLTVQIVEREIDLAKKQIYPMISLRMDKGNVNNVASSVNQDTRYSVVLEGRLQGGGFSSFNRIQSEVQRLESASMIYEAARVDVTKKISSLHNDAATFALNIEVYVQSISANRETYESYLRQYDAGRKGWMDVLNAIREWGDAEQQFIAVKSSYLERVLQLDAITGKLDAKVGI